MGCAGSTPVKEGGDLGAAAAKYSVSQEPAPGPSPQKSVQTAVQTPPQAPVPATQQPPAPATQGNGAAKAQTEATPVKNDVIKPATAPPSQTTTASSGQLAVSQSLKSLSVSEASTVQSTLFKVSMLIQKFAEGRTERTTPIQALRRALDLVVADAHAAFASVQVFPEALDTALLVGLIGAPDVYLESNRFLRLGQTGVAAETVLQANGDFFSWSPATKTPAPTDWQQLVTAAGMQYLSAVPFKVADKIIGLLTLGFKDNADEHAENAMWPTYMQLVAASISSMVKDNSIPKYLALVKDLHETTEVDGLMHKVVQHMRGILGHTNNHHIWYRVALTASSNAAATIFDDLTQVPAPLMQRTLSNQAAGSSSFKLLKEVQAQGGVMRTVVAMKSTVMKISVHNRQQVMIPDVQKLINQSGNVSIDIFNTRLIKPPTSVLVFPLKVKQHIFGVIFCMSSVQTDFSDISPRLRELCEVMSSHLLVVLSNSLVAEYKIVQTAQPMVNEGGSTTGASRNHSLSGRSVNDSMGGINMSMSGDSFIFTQSRSSTGALVTGLTEKLNQKRIKSSMDFAGNNSLVDLQISNLLGEGGFAKVFRGLWRGLVVGVKVVCDDGKNEKMVMKNAHEIAILGALSHPNIVQAYTCLTDVLVRELLQQSMKSTHHTVLQSSAYRYLAAMEDKTCHIEVIEYCDLGNMSTALKNSVFQVAQPDKVLASVVAAGEAGHTPEQRQPGTGKVHMRTLLLTLIEIASAMSYLHRMGVVHCDLKPANVLLKSSNNDPRGFTAKVSDFGLSRVEDDDNHSSFPFNSCGTAAYVAPEALICNKKVNSSVDVFAFGVLMWEMYTGQRPYGNMKQQQLVEEVVMRGLRPKFPSHAPPAYVALAQSCWSGSAQARPTFDESLTTLNSMLQSVDEKELGSYASGSFSSMSEAVEYMQGNVHRGNADGTGSTVGGAGGSGATAGGQARSSRQSANYGAPANNGSPMRGTFQGSAVPAQPSGLSAMSTNVSSPRQHTALQ